MSCGMRLPVFEYAADQRLCFHYIANKFTLINPKFKGSRHILQLQSPVCVITGQKPRIQVFA